MHLTFRLLALADGDWAIACLFILTMGDYLTFTPSAKCPICSLTKTLAVQLGIDKA
jgi:hypothetical protein